MMALVSDGQPFSLFWPSHTSSYKLCCFLRIIDVVCVSNELRYAMLVGIRTFTSLQLNVN